MFIWYPAMMLAIEAGGVFNQRMGRIWMDGTDGAFESRLMVTEKIAVGFEAATILARGGNCSHIVDHYRKKVAANALRLS